MISVCTRTVALRLLLFIWLLSGVEVYAIQYCDNNFKRHSVSLSRGSLGQSNLDTSAAAQLSTVTNEFASNWIIGETQQGETQQHAMAAGFNIQYTIMDFKSVTPMTNGHLYTVDFPLSGRIAGPGTEIVYKLTPAISVSSNALKNAELIDRNGLQLKTSFIYKNKLSVHNAWVFGFMSDHRFGEYQAYPLAGFCWQPANDWRLQLALPDFSVQKIFSGDINLMFYAEPYGNQWHVFSKDKTRSSDFNYETITAGITLGIYVNRSILMSIRAQRQVRRKLLLTLDNNSQIEPSVDSGTEFTLRAEVLF